MWDIGHLNGMKIKTWNLEVTMRVQETDSILTFMLCLKVWSREEESSGEENSGEESKGEWLSSTLFECF